MGIREYALTLQMTSKDLERYGRMALGIEFVVREIHFYTMFEVVYLQTQHPATELLSSTLVETYGKLLGYLAEATRYFTTRSLSTLSQLPYPLAIGGY
jgi:hypothetical protein